MGVRGVAAMLSTKNTFGCNIGRESEESSAHR